MSKTTIVTVSVVATLAFIVGAITFSDSVEEYAEEGIPLSCNVLVIPVNGYLSTYATGEDGVSTSDDVLDALQLAQSEEQIKAVILSIDSYGGDGVAGEEIANALKSFEKPSFAVIRGMGASSAYWASTGADWILASRISDVGGIGVTASYLDESVKNTREGYTRVELSSAQYKDVGDPTRSLTIAEKELILADIKKMHDVFVDDVAINRNLERDIVSGFANGLTYVGIDALEMGLIDEIGDITIATRYIEEQIEDWVETCWY
jgi:protease-4